MLDGIPPFSISIRIEPASDSKKAKIGRIKDDGDVARQEITFPQLDSLFKEKLKPTHKIIQFKDEKTLKKEIETLLRPFKQKDFDLTLGKSYYLGYLPDYAASCLATILKPFDGGEISLGKHSPFTTKQEKIFNDILKSTLPASSTRQRSYPRILTIFGLFNVGIRVLGGFSFVSTFCLGMTATFLFAKLSRKYAERFGSYYNTAEKITALPSQEKEALRIGFEAQSGYIGYFKSFTKYKAYRHYGAFLNGYNENNPTLIAAIQGEAAPPRPENGLSDAALAEKRLTRFAPEQIDAAREVRNNNNRMS